MSFYYKKDELENALRNIASDEVKSALSRLNMYSWDDFGFGENADWTGWTINEDSLIRITKYGFVAVVTSIGVRSMGAKFWKPGEESRSWTVEASGLCEEEVVDKMNRRAESDFGGWLTENKDNPLDHPFWDRWANIEDASGAIVRTTPEAIFTYYPSRNQLRIQCVPTEFKNVSVPKDPAALRDFIESLAASYGGFTN